MVVVVVLVVELVVEEVVVVVVVEVVVWVEVVVSSARALWLFSLEGKSCQTKLGHFKTCKASRRDKMTKWQHQQCGKF